MEEKERERENCSIVVVRDMTIWGLDLRNMTIIWYQMDIDEVNDAYEEYSKV